MALAEFGRLYHSRTGRGEIWITGWPGSARTLTYKDKPVNAKQARAGRPLLGAESGRSGCANVKISLLA
jgi:hypothetical protein